MSLVALDDLIAREKALIAALDADDVAAIETATAGFQGALEALGLAGRMGEAAALRPRISEAMMLADAARVRVAFLADATRRRIERLAAATGRSDAGLYRSNGRLRA
jgi:hypothetical protein